MYKKVFKRLLDFALSLIGIIVLSPFFLIFIILGAIFMRGNPFYLSERAGKNDTRFKMIKFKSMTNKKDKDGNLLSPELRVNKYGNFIRKTSIDELPQIFNILIGNMSIVGPRPLPPDRLADCVGELSVRYDVLPGLTGLAQVSGRNGLTFIEKFHYDAEYVNTLSFKNDVKIFFKTFGVVFKQSGVKYADGRVDNLPTDESQQKKD